MEWQESELPLPLVSSLPFTVLNSNNNPIDTGTDNPEVAQRLETQPNEASSFFFEQQQQREQEPIADGGQQTGDASAQSKERDQAAGSDLSQQEATDLRPTLWSLVSVNGTTGEVITEVAPGSLFALDKPFLFRRISLTQMKRMCRITLS